MGGGAVPGGRRYPRAGGGGLRRVRHRGNGHAECGDLGGGDLALGGAIRERGIPAAPLVAGTVAFSRVVRPADGSIPDNADIFVIRADGTYLEQLTDDTDPSWAPDGRIVSTN